MSLPSFWDTTFTWFPSCATGLSFSVSFGGPSSSARLFNKESGPGPLLFHQTFSQGDQSTLMILCSIFIFVNFIIKYPPRTSPLSTRNTDFTIYLTPRWSDKQKTREEKKAMKKNLIVWKVTRLEKTKSDFKVSAFMLNFSCFSFHISNQIMKWHTSGFWC